MKIGIVIQARMASTRFPGKAMKKIAGKPILWWVIQRLKKIKKANQLIIATTNNPKDKVIIDFAKANRISCFMGSEEDVLDRYYQAAKNFGLDHIVRATADNPLVDPAEADNLIELHLKTGADYSSSKSEIKSGFPEGVGLEVFTFVALEKTWKEAKLPHHREHVNDYILENPSKFKISILHAPKEKYAPNLRLTVDTLEDFKHIREILRFSRLNLTKLTRDRA